MKKFAILIVVALLAISSAWADNPFNPTEQAIANFTCNVIVPITMTVSNTTITLPEVIQGQTRDITDVNINFTVAGESGYDYILTLTDPEEADGVILDGTWSIDNGTYEFGTTATPFKYTIDKINADGAESTGEKTFTIKAEAVYTGI